MLVAIKPDTTTKQTLYASTASLGGASHISTNQPPLYIYMCDGAGIYLCSHPSLKPAGLQQFPNNLDFKYCSSSYWFIIHASFFCCQRSKGYSSVWNLVLWTSSRRIWKFSTPPPPPPVVTCVSELWLVFLWQRGISQIILPLVDLRVCTGVRLGFMFFHCQVCVLYSLRWWK